jgi:hypothetical protein
MQEPRSSVYFERRAEEERAAAGRSTDERAAQAHRELADHYRKLAEGGQQPTADDGDGEPGAVWNEFHIVP